MKRSLVIALFAGLLTTAGCERYPYVTPNGDGHVGSPTDSTLSGPPPSYTYEVVQTYPHDDSAYTQGLVYRDSVLYEGTGQHPYFGPGSPFNGRSSLRRVDLASGTVQAATDLPVEFFGEGIVDVGDEVYQLTWLSRTGFVYDLETFAFKRSFSYATEGWGLTHDGRRFIMSDGTSNLYFRDLQTFAEIGRVQVSDNRGPVSRLNELEYINGEVYANIWQTNSIARINPITGHVLGWIDLTGILPADQRPSDAGGVLNGIAYDAEGDRLFVTGKLWPHLYEIRLVPR